MKQFFLTTILFLISNNILLGNFSLKKVTAKQNFIQNDLERILEEAELDKDYIQFEWIENRKNYAEVICNDNSFLIEVYASDEEWSSVFYNTLQQLGFLFPHPRIQISPESISEKFCGKRYYWKPALKYRGFHLHTMHPSEWVHGFMMGESEIAYETIHWLARNQQNIFQFSFQRTNKKKLFEYLTPIYEYAQNMGLYTGVSFGVALQQQNNPKLVSLLGTFSDKKSAKQIDKNLRFILESLPLSFFSAEAGTSEFTAVNYERSLNWINQLGDIASEYDVQMMTKVHISSNQEHPEYGNYNFLPQHADKQVGVMPHTVFYYALEDKKAPMYGNENFADMKDFMLQENKKRMTWFYPETSYYISLDIDIPFLHLEYLRARAADMQLIYDNELTGQINFTTGQELGYWLFDWTVALLNNSYYKFDPLIALKLLDENTDIWQEHLDFHFEYMTNEQLVAIVTFSNGGDELFPNHKIHERNLLRELKNSESKTLTEIEKLEKAIDAIPSTNGIKNRELKAYLDISYHRFYHALYVRKALLNNKEGNLQKAADYREKAQALMDEMIADFNRYPEAKIFEHHKNVTAYNYGYGAMAENLYYWQREEEMVRKNKYHPLFMKVYNYLDILF